MTWSGASSGEHFLASNPPPNMTVGTGGATYDKGGAVWHVKERGAKLDGSSAGDTTAINNTIADAVAGGGGTVMIGSGTPYLDTGPVVPAANVAIRGAGLGATVFKANGALTGGNADLIRFSIATNGTYLVDVALSDFTLDCTAQTQGNGMTLQGFTRLVGERIRVLNPFAYGIVVGTQAGGTPYSTGLLLDTIYVDGERNGNDSIGGGGILRGTIANYYCTGAAGTASDLTNIQNFVYRNVYCFRSSVTTGTQDGFDTDFGANNVLWDGVFVDGCQFAMVIAGNAGQAVATNVQIHHFSFVNMQKGAISCNSAAGKGPVGVTISDGYIAAWNGNNTGVQAVKFQGGTDILMHDVIYGAPTNPAYAIQLANDGGAANPPTKGRFHDIDMTATANTVQLTNVGADVKFSDNPGYNPVGTEVVAVPASTVAVVAATNDRTYYVTAGASTVTMAIQNGPSPVIPANAFGTIRVPAGKTVTPTYANAPTWVVEGE